MDSDVFTITVSFDGKALNLIHQKGEGTPAEIKNVTSVTLNAGSKGYKLSINDVPWMLDEIHKVVTEIEEEENSPEPKRGQYL